MIIKPLLNSQRILGLSIVLLLLGILHLPGTFSAIAGEKFSGAPQADNGSEDYLIGKGDILEIVVWNEPNLSRTVRVRPDGKISLPLVDDIQASQSTLLQLKKRITQVLSGYFDYSPSVYVILQENRSKKVYILGKVSAPGEYVLEKKINVIQALAMARGFAEWADKQDIVIVRKTSNGLHLIDFDYDHLVNGKNMKQDISLQADDVIIVP
jgi:polysaccharide export outer membrane protein